MMEDVTGSYDNFLQYWKQQTEEELHRDGSGEQHDHVHLKIEKQSRDLYTFSIYRGRNNTEFIGSAEYDLSRENHNIVIDADTVQIQELKGVHNQKSPYVFRRCRFFSGFVEYQLPDQPEEYYRMGNLELHDQGAMVQLDYPGTTYTVELTQLVFAHKIPLMKVAIYNMPMEKVMINSKAISYAWTSPDAKRIGINIRKIVTGWTLIEEGFLSSNNLDLAKT